MDLWRITGEQPICPWNRHLIPTQNLPLFSNTFLSALFCESSSSGVGLLQTRLDLIGCTVSLRGSLFRLSLVN